jgi:hypothetical protein
VNVVRGLLSGTKAGLTLGLAQGVFTLFSGTAAWNIYGWKKAGWYLGILVVLQWFSAIVNLGLVDNWFYLLFSVPMVVVAIWLLLPAVKARFGLGKAT